MKVSVNWLKTLVDTRLSVDALAHALTMAGLEVEEIHPVGAAISKVVVGEVKTVAPHPDADKLRVTEVDVGAGTLLQIVCGAPNVAVGMRVPCALVGAVLPGIEIKEAKLRGVASSGMLCSAKELGLSDDHGGLLALPQDSPLGQDVRVTLDLDDIILTLKLTPNRGDCLSMIGVARDLAAATQSPLTLPDQVEVPANSDDKREVKITAPAACGRYLGRVVRNIDAAAATPDWMKRRLERAGLRPIAPLVDITNYVMLLYGQPMHAFDLDKLRGDIDVRLARSGEYITLLNEQQVALKPDMLVIADSAGAVALAGVMGGLASMVTATTTNVMFEAAHFDPDVIQGKARSLSLNSDAAFRFERGVDPDLPRRAIEFATQLAIAICGTAQTKVGIITEALGTLRAKAMIALHAERVVAAIGAPVEKAAMETILLALNCAIRHNFGVVEVTPPSYRFDLNIEADLTEEIARLYGYARIPVRAPRAAVAMQAVPTRRRSASSLKRDLAALGYQEIISYSFVPARWEESLAGNRAPIRLANPIASQMSVMRSSLIGGLIEAAKHNLNRGESRLRLFEYGRCFERAVAEVTAQPERVAGLLYGARHPEQWGADNTQLVDFFDAKAHVEALLADHDVILTALTDHPALHPGRAAAVLIGGEVGGFVGELHPKWQQEFDLPLAPVVFQLDAAFLLNASAKRFDGMSRMPAVRRDIAILVDHSVSAAACIDAIKSRKMSGLVDFALFDLYQGAKLDSGKKSLAFRIVMQDTERTLTDIEIAKTCEDILKVLHEECNATIRK